MYKKEQSTIDNSGLDLFNDNNYDKVKNFKHTSIDLKLMIPRNNPSLSKIIKVKASKEIVKTKLVRTPIGVSLEGQKLTGYEALVIADIILKITYIALTVTESLHSFYAIIPFCDHVVMPESYNILEDVVPSLFIEDIMLNKCDDGSLYGVMSIMTVVDSDKYRGGNKDV